MFGAHYSSNAFDGAALCHHRPRASGHPFSFCSPAIGRVWNITFHFCTIRSVSRLRMELTYHMVATTNTDHIVFALTSGVMR